MQGAAVDSVRTEDNVVENVTESDGCAPQVHATCTVDLLADSYIRHLDFCVEVGLVSRAGWVLDFVSRYDLSHSEELRGFFEKAEEWLPKAQEYEARHGKGSLLNRQHPRFRAAIEGALVSTASRLLFD